MYTANPATGATNEIVIRFGDGTEPGGRAGASRGEIVLGTSTLRVKQRPDRAGPASLPLNGRHLAALRGHAARQTARNDGRPQQIRWELRDGEVKITRSTALTGVEFTWDEDIDAWQRLPEDPDTVWTLQWANEAWNGATTPLHYSITARECEEGHVTLRTNLGATNTLKLRQFKYWHGRAYYNTAVDAQHAQLIAPPSLRPGMLANVHPDDRPAVLDAGFEVADLIRVVVRQIIDPQSGPNSWLRESYRYMDDDPAANRGLTDEQLRDLNDLDLTAYIDSRIQRSSDFNAQMWLGFYTYGTWAMQALGVLLQRWFPGVEPAQVPGTLQELISGLPLPATIQATERHELWRLATTIRSSPALLALLNRSAPGEFLERLTDTEEGREFLAQYQAFLHVYGSRGSADRDIYYPRREEDPGLDNAAFRLIANSSREESPEDLERRQRARRAAVSGRLLAELRRQPFGGMKAAAFTALLDYVHRFLRLRDDQRHTYDIISVSKKRGLQEVSRRLAERSELDSGDDFYFLSMPELFAVLRGTTTDSRWLTSAKIAGRRARFRRVHHRSETLPMYIKDGAPYSDGAGTPDVAVEAANGGVLTGIGTSGGRVTGRARVLPHLDGLAYLGDEEILVCPNTDPGWAAAFSVIAGLVMEDGRMLSPGACMAREHGIPAVTVPAAMSRIPDGALITIDGGTGQVVLEEVPRR